MEHSYQTRGQPERRSTSAQTFQSKGKCEIQIRFEVPTGLFIYTYLFLFVPSHIYIYFTWHIFPPKSIKTLCNTLSLQRLFHTIHPATITMEILLYLWYFLLLVLTASFAPIVYSNVYFYYLYPSRFLTALLYIEVNN